MFLEPLVLCEETKRYCSLCVRWTVSAPCKGLIAYKMFFFAVSLPLVFLLSIPASIARPSNVKLRSLPQPQGESLQIPPQLNQSNSDQGPPVYPIYPSTCFPPSPGSGAQYLPDRHDVLRDCFYVINNFILRLDDLLFQDLFFRYSSFQDKYGQTYISRWAHGQCVIAVSSMERREKDIVQLFNVALSANQILKDCLIDRKTTEGGTTHIGHSEGSFYVSVLGYEEEKGENSSSPSNTVRPRTLPQSNGLLPQYGPSGALSQLNMTTQLADYPVYPTNCYSPRSTFWLDPVLVLRDCYFIINEVLSRLPDLPQNIPFHDYRYQNRAGRWQSSRWRHGHCIITVGNADDSEETNLQLLNVALAANKVIKECLSERRIAQGGVVKIGNADQHFFVGILGYFRLNSLNNSSGLDSRSLLLATSLSSAQDSSITQLNVTDLQGPTAHPVACFPPRAPAHSGPYSHPDVVLADCSYILNEIILKTSYVFELLTFTFFEYRDPQGYRHQSRWAYGMCVISVSSMKARGSQTLGLLEVALTANKILADCIRDNKRIEGGTSPVGPSGTEYYVGVVGYTPEDPPPRYGGDAADNSRAPLLPNVEVSGQQQDSPSTSEIRSLRTSSGSLPSLNTLNSNTRAPSQYPVLCFNPYSTRLARAVVEDCEVIINEIILRYPNPMMPQTFGYTTNVDIDLSLPENQKWFYGHCAMFVRNLNQMRTDKFRMVDVAVTAHRIMKECVIDTKYEIGGTADVGTTEGDFYVCVGGIPEANAVNETLLSLPSSGTNLTLPVGPVEERFTPLEDGKEASTLSKRIDNVTHLDDTFAPPVACVKPGTAAVESRLVVSDCMAAAKIILTDPNVLTPASFTTEPNGGIHVPLVLQHGGCWLMVNTHSEFSASETFTLLKVVFFAAEVMRKCALGGVAKISKDRQGFFVSVTAIDPQPSGDELSNLLNGTDPSLGLGVGSSLQTANLGIT